MNEYKSDWEDLIDEIELLSIKYNGKVGLIDRMRLSLLRFISKFMKNIKKYGEE